MHPRPQSSFRGWAAYSAAWLALAALWALASAQQTGRSPLSTLPYGLLVMGVAAGMGVGVWRLTGVLPWDRSRFRFAAVHALTGAGFAMGYALGFYLPDLSAEPVGNVLSAFAANPFSGWNLMMGSWLYLMVAGLSYVVRGQQRLVRQVSIEAETREEARRAQLAALRARLNPHFLFNSLHTVSALVKSDPVAADEALDRLGGLLRYVLDDADDFVTFRDEWRFTREYLALEQLRLGDRLRVRPEVDPEVLGVTIPALLLQPLVENAVRHGIAPCAEGATLTVRASQKGGRLRIEVHDDGVGASGLTAEDAPRGDGVSGIGLGTIRDRLKVLHGDRASLEVSSPGESGFRVVVCLPITPDPGDDSR